MKTLMSISIFLFSMISFAYPAVNDSVTYNGKYIIVENDNFTVGFIQEANITSLNKESGKFTVHNSLYLPDGSVQEEDVETASSEMKSRKQVLELLQNCQAAGGKPEVIEVVGGTFSTCHLTVEKGDLWIGDVPFAIVKQTEKDDQGNIIDLEISLYNPSAE
jgi:hypothetical protein